ncbi:MAG TPA: alanine racemase [Alphaproteobacteria bacterium]|nr:alanine racemase [Alphaproteobacteria bacterium]
MAIRRRPVRPGASGHPSQSTLTIDLAAIAANYRTLRKQLRRPTTCAAVVKADAYGLGAERVVPALAAAGCREFFVAQLEEAEAIRRVVPAQAAVCVLNGLLHGEEGAFRRRGFIPVLNDMAQVECWQRAARSSGRPLPAILHVDTGMSRLGLAPGDALALAAPGRLEGLALHAVISHLACSEEPEQPLNAQQLATFQTVRAAFPRVRASLANSSGIFLNPAYHFDFVRPGAALFGVNPLPGRPNPLRAVVTLRGKILQIRDVDPPRSVGYGATHRITGRTRIATVAAGYADGWPRSLSNRGSAYIGDLRVPVIGRVSMDLMTLDITAAPDVAPGDTVELLGGHLPVDDVATAAGTIAYEILTRLGRRYHRIYKGGPASR